MAKRVTLKCWNTDCEREYSLLRDVGQAKLFVECPFCGAEGEVDLAPWRDPAMSTMHGSGAEEQNLGDALNLPDVLPTTTREE
ncbi:MAG: hypothetical protein HF973_05485 [Chloroflexi bacterium]|nr:hypothetical protein [Chloroflexota bacterium]